jgi:hypothetical protein
MIASDMEDLRIVEQQFQYLSEGSNQLSWNHFFQWDETQALLSEKLFDQKEIEKFWIHVVGDLKRPCNLQNFIEINRLIDDEFEDEGDEGDKDNEEEDESNINFAKTSNILSTTNNFWDPNLKVKELFDPNFYNYLKNHFQRYSKNNLLSYATFTNWNDVLDLMKSGNIDTDILNDLWLEAFQNRINKVIDNNNDMKNYLVDFDVFLRLNLRLNEIIEEVDAAMASLTNEDYDKYYVEEFNKLTQSLSVKIPDREQELPLLTFKKLLDWPDLIQTMAECNLKKNDILSIWNSLKTQPCRYVLVNDNKGFESNKVQIIETDGIDKSEFINFNYMLEKYITSKVEPAPTVWEPIEKLDDE